MNDRTDGKFVALSAGTTHYELTGEDEAKTVVLVHGNALPYVSWDNTVGALVEAGFRVLRYDVFGHGFSDRPDLYRYDKDLYDRQLVELLDELGIQGSVYVAGSSQGGCISTCFAARHAGRVEKLALLAPIFDTYIGAGKATLMRVPGVGELLIRWLGAEGAIDPSKGLYCDDGKAALLARFREQLQCEGKEGAVLANLRGNALDDATEFYLDVKKQGIPILLTWGKQDRSISEQSMSRLRKLVPSIEYHELENAGHLAHHEFPERINPLLIDFFRR